MEISWAQGATWAGAITAGITLLAWTLVRAAKQQDEELEKRRQKRRNYEKTQRDWEIAAETGDAENMLILKRKLDAMRRKGWHLAIFAMMLFFIQGCKTTGTKKTVIVTVPIGKHIRTIQPGEPVPELPEGEPRWWLATPTGLKLLLPDDSPIPETDE